MRKLQFYLAHPLNMRKEVRKWELEMEKKYPLILLNPFYDVEGRVDIQALDKGLSIPRSVKKRKDGLIVVDRDLEHVEKGDGIICFIYKGQESFGTPMEFFYSSRILQKPTYVITSSMAGHPWIRGLATGIFRTKEKLEEYLYEKYFHRK